MKLSLPHIIIACIFRGKKKMVFTFKSTEDAKKAFKLASETKLPTGQYMNVQPQKWGQSN